jgi:hypothetical protein
MAAGADAILNRCTAITFLTSVLNSTAAAPIASSAVLATTWPSRLALAAAR